eukprot:365383-Chlamydomonas_euryale.AAC.7
MLTPSMTAWPASRRVRHSLNIRNPATDHWPPASRFNFFVAGYSRTGYRRIPINVHSFSFAPSRSHCVVLVAVPAAIHTLCGAYTYASCSARRWENIKSTLTAISSAPRTTILQVCQGELRDTGWASEIDCGLSQRDGDTEMGSLTWPTAAGWSSSWAFTATPEASISRSSDRWPAAATTSPNPAAGLLRRHQLFIDQVSVSHV